MDCITENTIAAYFDGELAEQDRDRLLSHTEQCAACRRLLAAVTRNLFPEQEDPPAKEGLAEDLATPALIRGSSVGRYLILDWLGAGGMGVVYAAYDPDLDRRVALKLLLRGGGEVQRARLLREAQAMARLSHPNVLAVYDAGTYKGQVYLALELVEGSTLGAWLNSPLEKRDQRAILDVFTGAGQGLLAAHQAGLVHRDFNPNNVLVGRDGRVRVMDFGLARLNQCTTQADPSTPQPALVLSNTGSLMGTPAYMAPEQHRGGPLDPRTDQFAFCVALYEALYGERPFAGDSVEELSQNVQAGVVRPTGATALPGWLRAVLLRGLRPSPDDRFPDMAALLSALHQDPLRRRGTLVRRLGALAAVAGMAAVTFLWLPYLLRRPQRLCNEAGERLARGLWSQDRQQRVAAAFQASGKPYAAATLKAVQAAAAGYIEAFRRSHGAACQATHARGTQSTMLLDLRMGCLERRQQEWTALAELLEQPRPDDALLANGARAFQGLPPPTQCDDTEALVSRGPKPVEPGRKKEAAQLEEGLARLTALREGGRLKEALAQGGDLLVRAERLAHGPLLSEAQQLLGSLHEKQGDLATATKHYYEALLSAERHRYDTHGARIWISLLSTLRRNPTYPEEPRLVGRLAEAAVDRVGPHPELEMMLNYQMGAMYTKDHQAAEGLRRHRLALELLPRVRPWDAYTESVMVGAIGLDLHELGRHDEGLEYERRALRVLQTNLGLEHPALLQTLNNVALSVLYAGHCEEALRMAMQALQIGESAIGPQSPKVANLLSTVGEVLLGCRREAEAVVYYERALKRMEALLSPQSPEICDTLNNYGHTLIKLKRYDEARTSIERALHNLTTHRGADHPRSYEYHSSLGELLLMQGDAKAALPKFQTSLAKREQVLGPKNPQLAPELLGISRCHLALQQPALALPLLERALVLLQGAGEPAPLAEVRFNLARTLRLLDREPARARSLALVAQGTYGRLSGHGPEQAAVAAWLKEGP